MDHENSHVGKRLRELRRWRGMTQEQVAGLAGFTKGYISMIERGAPVEKRSTLEAIAAAVRVAPSELAAIPWPATDQVAGEARAVNGDIATALADFRLGDEVERRPRPWPEIARDLHRLVTELWPQADYAAQGYLIPDLIEELHAVHNTVPEHRTDALIGLAACYHAVAVATKNTGMRPLAWVAADRLTSVAEKLGRPEYSAYAAWVRAHMIGGVGRERQVRQAVRSLNSLAGQTSSDEVLQAIGQLHLTAAMANASLRRADDAWAHLDEAEQVARHTDREVGAFANMWFGRTNVGFWRMSLAVELGRHDVVEQAAQSVQPSLIPSLGRQSQFYSDYGRALAQDKRTRTQAVHELSRAEKLAPQLIRNNPLVRESVLDLLRRRLPDSVARELRALAWRLNITPNGGTAAK